jgi:hypothetical protein
VISVLKFCDVLPVLTVISICATASPANALSTTMVVARAVWIEWPGRMGLRFMAMMVWMIAGEFTPGLPAGENVAVSNAVGQSRTRDILVNERLQPAEQNQVSEKNARAA